MRIPEDFSVTGYDDYAWSATLGLTSIHVPVEEMASRAIEIIQQRLRDPSQDHRVEIVVRPWLLVRESTGAPRQQDN
jgi:LacI family transcriptional regulator